MSIKTGMKNARTALRVVKKTLDPLARALDEAKEFDRVEGSAHSAAAVRALEIAIMEVEGVKQYLDGRIWKHMTEGDER